MSTKNEILNMLEENTGKSVSGEYLAERLEISRAAVWKAIKSLQNDGLAIQAVTNKGYCLLKDNDIINKNIIEKYIKADSKIKFNIEILDCVSSTNTYLKELAVLGEAEGKVVIAKTQTGGKGRLGRSFFSPAGSGLYISILLRPDMDMASSLKITTAAAVAVCRAIETVSGMKPGIKWVNDIYLNERKICGILTEASMDFESGNLEYAVIGAGINIFEPEEGFSEELKNIAGALYSYNDSSVDFIEIRSKIAAELLNNMALFYETGYKPAIMEEYRERSFLTGRKVLISKIGRDISTDKEEGTVLGIDDDAGLIVRLEDGNIKTLTSGEVSIKI